MDYPAWLGSLSKKDEALRVAHGLYPARDGWYKTIDLKKRYIASAKKTLAEAIQILPSRVADVRGTVVEKATVLATGSTTIEQLGEMFVAHLWQRVTTGQPRPMRRRVYDDYVTLLDRFIETVGPRQPAVAINPTWFSKFARSFNGKAPTSIRREIIYLTTFFNWAGPGRHSQNFYKEPVQFGPDFKKPDEAKLRASLANSSTLMTAGEFAAALDAASPSPLLYAVGLVGLNCAFLPEDLVTVPMTAFDMAAGIVEFPRGKTHIPRRAVLMPETIDAIEHYLRYRPESAAADGPMFVRDDGLPFNQRRERGQDEKAGRHNALSRYWRSVTGHPLKGLRTTFATEADGSVDQRAVDLVMGHAAKSVRARHYVKQFDPERLRSVIDAVWQRVAPRTPRQSVATIGASPLAHRLEPRGERLAKRRSRQAGSGSGTASTSATARRGRRARPTR